VNDFTFERNKVTTEKVYWRCSFKSCGITLTTNVFDDDNTSQQGFCIRGGIM